jgi:TolB protein
VTKIDIAKNLMKAKVGTLRLKIEHADSSIRLTLIMRWIIRGLFVVVPLSQLLAEPKPLLPGETSGRKLNEESAWSPNGKLIAFDSERDGKTSIFVVDLATREIKRLTESGANDITPAWSPDGKQIAFVSDRSGHNEIFVMNADGSGTKQLTHDNSDGIHPDWSRNGKRLIYCSARDNPDPSTAAEGKLYEIYLVDLTGSAPIRLTKAGGINTYPSYSPEGSQILFRKVLGERNSEVFVMNADGSGKRNLTNNAAFDAWPRWSPDGRRIVFASNRENGTDYEIFLMNSDGSNVQRISEMKARNTSPKWSPDGKKISFDHAVQGECDIFTIDAPAK